jgi:hypothetical protein
MVSGGFVLFKSAQMSAPCNTRIKKTFTCKIFPNFLLDSHGRPWLAQLVVRASVSSSVACSVKSNGKYCLLRLFFVAH